MPDSHYFPCYIAALKSSRMQDRTQALVLFVYLFISYVLSVALCALCIARIMTFQSLKTNRVEPDHSGTAGFGTALV